MMINDFYEGCLIVINLKYKYMEYQTYKSTTTLALILAILASSAIASPSSSCLPDCIYCDQNDLTVCYHCRPGTYLAKDNKCQPCANGCQICENPTTCSQCSLGFVQQNGTCIACPNFCQQCTVLSNLQVPSCSACIAGFFPINQTEAGEKITLCRPCLPSCIKCSDGISCDQCAYGFGYNQTSSECFACGDQCTSCDDQKGCTSCSEGFYPQNKNGSQLAVCETCIENCQQCDSIGSCTSCQDGFFVKAGSCQSCTQPCLSCYNESVCTKCERGYYLDLSTDEGDGNDTYAFGCYPCSDNCLGCSNGSACYLCPTGYFINEEEQCQLCGSACSQCNPEGECLLCTGSFYLFEGSCHACPSQCTQCNADSGGEPYCYNCIDAYSTPIDGVCTECSSLSLGCSTCSSQYNCLTCQIGYYLLNGECIVDGGGLPTIYIVLIVIAGLIGLAAIIFGVWACWRSRNGYGVMGEGSNAGGVRASYYQMP